MMGEERFRLITVALSAIYSGLLAFGGFMMHVALSHHNNLWWLWIIPIVIWGLSIVAVVAWYFVRGAKR